MMKPKLLMLAVLLLVSALLTGCGSSSSADAYIARLRGESGAPAMYAITPTAAPTATPRPTARLSGSTEASVSSAEPLADVSPKSPTTAPTATPAPTAAPVATSPQAAPAQASIPTLPDDDAWLHVALGGFVLFVLFAVWLGRTAGRIARL
ncbi:MAG: hypothetical protein RMN52_02335 [Anaerolineae bacterium]|nr:hypothetical protein [Candidatus Roseilinea sp.]MDW8448819.1 hypothetical protein [Anaerolineae bacterium]